MSKVALVTGARKGLGRHITEHLLEQGWSVAGCSRKDSDLSHPNYQHYCLNISDEPAVVHMMHAIKKAFGPIDALINNAGTASMNHLLLTPASSAQSVFDTNVIGTFLCLRECAKQMSRQKSGRIINLSSVAAAIDLEGEAIYAASKSAVESLTRTASKELAPHGITVNAIGPTPIETDLIRAIPKPKIDALLQRQAIPRMGTLADLTNCIDFFLQPESDFVTGQVLYLGGITA